MKDKLKGNDGGVYSDKGLTDVYQRAFITYLKVEELTGGSIFAFLACQTQVNKYMKRIGLKEGVPFEKDYVKMAFYREAGAFYKERVLYVNECLRTGDIIDPTKGCTATLDVIDLIAPQVFAAHGKAAGINVKLSYNLNEILEKRLA